MAKTQSEYELGNAFSGEDPLKTLYGYLTAASGKPIQQSEEASIRIFFAKLAFAFCGGKDVLTEEQLNPLGTPLNYGQMQEQYRKQLAMERMPYLAVSSEMNVIYEGAPPWLVALPEEAPDSLLAAIKNLGISAELGGCANLQPTPGAALPGQRFLQPSIGALGGAPALKPAPAQMAARRWGTILSIAAIGGAVWWFLMGRNGKKKSKKKSKKLRR